MTDELKPCPFCGKNDSCYVDFDSTCYECQSCGAMCNSLDDWQSRPLEAALQAQVDRLSDAIQEILTFKGNNPFVSLGDFDHVYEIAREALEGG